MTFMRITGCITADSLMSLEDYARWRQVHKSSVMAYRRLRSVPLGEHLRVQFESEITMRYQIQEMLRIEKTVEPRGIQDEIDVYAPLVPDGGNWKATLLLEYPDAAQRQRELALLIDVEDHLFVEVAGHERVVAIADEDLDRETATKTAAVHFLRFELSPAMRADVKAGALVHLGCDHPHETVRVAIPSDTRASLAEDLR